MKIDGLAKLRAGEDLSLKEQLALIMRLSVPAIMAQISSIIMEYIDASMVGRLGAADSASIGLVSTSTWLMWGMCSSLSTGFTVQVAHAVGADDDKKARSIVRQGLFCALCFSILVMLAGIAISGTLPAWLGGEDDICHNASLYFMICAIMMPVVQFNSIAGGMLQCSGNMKIPGILHIIMCVLDVLFNAVLIFPTRTINVFGYTVSIYGADLKVAGAAIGTGMAELLTVFFMLYFLLIKSEKLHLRKSEHLEFNFSELKRAFKIAVPVAAENIVMCSAQIMTTKIIAPLGMIAIAANSFAVTAESLCYMPGYGISAAATTLIGQSIGAGKRLTAKKLGWLTTAIGSAVMAVMAVLMYIFAPVMIGILSPVEEIRKLGSDVLRIEAFAEPLFGASIIATGVFRGAGDTLIPFALNLLTMWLVRIPLAALLCPVMGLYGAWIAMCTELCIRGLLFILMLVKRRWWDYRKTP
jgi:putative MATE family efflux protein